MNFVIFVYNSKIIYEVKLMSNFQLTLEKLGRNGNEHEGYTLEPDDNTIVWIKEKKFKGIMKAVRWLKSHHPKLGIRLNCIDKIDRFNYRCYVSDSSNYYQDLRGLHSNSVGMVFVTIRQFVYENNDRDNEKLFYYDGCWQR